MKHLFLLSCSLVCSLAQATVSDDLRHAIIDSDIKKVLELLPSFSEQDKSSFVQLAQEILDKRAKDYEAYRIVPPISLPVTATFAAGFATYLYCSQRNNLFNMNLAFNNFMQMFYNLASAVVGRQDIRNHLLENGVPLPSQETFVAALAEAKQDEKMLNLMYKLNKVGIVAGMGLIATSVWLMFHDQQHVHDIYMSALEIKYLLATPQNAITDAQDVLVQA
jgi:hypothetical protein